MFAHVRKGRLYSNVQIQMHTPYEVDTSSEWDTAVSVHDVSVQLSVLHVGSAYLKSVLTPHRSPRSCQNRLYRPLDPPLPGRCPSGSVRFATIRLADVRRPCNTSKYRRTDIQNLDWVCRQLKVCLYKKHERRQNSTVYTRSILLTRSQLASRRTPGVWHEAGPTHEPYICIPAHPTATGYHNSCESTPHAGMGHSTELAYTTGKGHAARKGLYLSTGLHHKAGPYKRAGLKHTLTHQGCMGMQ